MPTVLSCYYSDMADVETDDGAIQRPKSEYWL